MASPFPLQTGFAGMVRDSARDQLPPTALWNLVDYIPAVMDAPLRKRGGWAYGSPALGTSTYIDAVQYAPFSGGAKNLAIGQDANLYSFVDASTSSSIGAVFAVAQNPVFYRDTVFIPAASGSTAPKSYNGTTLAALGGSPPAAVYGTVYHDHAVLAKTTANPNRVWFATAGNPASWDTTQGWLDSSAPVTGIASLRNAILIYHEGFTERMRGTSPPPGASPDLVLENVFEVGCVDARSIVTHEDSVIWADLRGVYQSDGAALLDLTEVGGMKSYWRTQLLAYTTSWTIAAGLYRGMYLVSLMNGTTFVDALAFDLNRRTWYRLANFPGRCFARTTSGVPETFMGLANAGRVATLSSIMTPASGVKNDANGTAVTPVFETAYFRGRGVDFALKTWKNVYADYDVRDAASDDPILTLSYLTSPEASSYAALTPTLAETTKYARRRIPIGIASTGIAFKLAQTNASSDTRFYGLECEFWSRERSRL